MSGTGRSSLVGVRITARQDQALTRRANDLRLNSEDKAATRSSVAYDLMRPGLDALVAFYFASDEDSNPQNQGLDTDD